MSRTKLYAGLVKNGKWYNYVEVHPLKGGALALLDTGDKSGGGKLLNLMKGSFDELETEDGEKHKMTVQDYLELKVVDTWKIGYEEIKLTAGTDYPIIPENFYCPRCSKPKSEKYTEVRESWAKLIEDGLIDEYFCEDQNCKFEVDLPEPIIIEGGRVIVGGEYNTIIMQPLTVNDIIRIQKNPEAMENEANEIYAVWDAMLVGIKGMTEREFNIIKRVPNRFFSKTYMNSQANFEAIEQALSEHTLGIVADTRKIYCKNCGEEIGGSLDLTNFFTLLLPKKSTSIHHTV